MKKSLLFLVALIGALGFQSSCFAGYDVDYSSIMGIKWANPFAEDKADYERSDLFESDRFVYLMRDFDIQGNGRGSGLSLSFIRYYNNKLNNDGVSGNSWAA